MTTISPATLVTRVGTYEPRERMDQSGPSEELLLISANLKEAIEGLSAWVQIHPLLHRLEGDSLTLAAKEIAFLSGVFQTAHLELISYSRQIPEPADLPIAADMQKLLEKCFLFDAAAETACEIAGHGFTSWGALILSQKKIEWTPVMIQQLFEQIPSSGWRKTRAILTETAAQLP